VNTKNLVQVYLIDHWLYQFESDHFDTDEYLVLIDDKVQRFLEKKDFLLTLNIYLTKISDEFFS